MSRFALAVLAALLLPCGLDHAARAATSADERVAVSTAAEFNDAIGSGEQDRTIALRPGEYDDLRIENRKEGRIRIVAFDRSNAPVVRRLLISASRNVTIEGLRFAASGKEAPDSALLEIRDSDGVGILRSHFSAVPAPGFLGVRAVVATDSRRLRIADNTAEGTNNALLLAKVDDVVVEHNLFRRLAFGTITAVEATGLVIEGNRFDGHANDIGRSGNFIQFWTRNTAGPSRDIRIRYNVMIQDTPIGAQGIVMSNEDDIPYADVTIANNIIVIGSPNGITVNLAENVSVENNILIDTLESNFNNGIRLNKVRAGRLTNNLASAYALTFSGDLVRQKNSTVQRMDNRLRRTLGQRIEEALAGSGRSIIFAGHSVLPEHRAAGPRAP